MDLDRPGGWRRPQGPNKGADLDLRPARQYFRRFNRVDFKKLRAARRRIDLISDRIAIAFFDSPNAVYSAACTIWHSCDGCLHDRRIEAVDGEDIKDIAWDNTRAAIFQFLREDFGGFLGMSRSLNLYSQGVRLVSRAATMKSITPSSRSSLIKLPGSCQRSVMARAALFRFGESARRWLASSKKMSMS